MKLFRIRSLAATLLAAGLLLSACGQSDASGRVRNSSLGDGCFATQAAKDSEIKYYQDFLDLSTTTKSEFETIDKAVKELQVLLTDLYNKTTEALNESKAKPSPENSAKVLAVNTELDAKQKELNDLFPKLFETQRNIREYPQFETALQDIQNKPVCESTPETVEQPVIAEGPTESTNNTTSVDNQITTDTTNTISNNQTTKTNVEECQQPLEVEGGVNQVIRVGETVDFVFPSCSEDSYVTVWGDFETGLSVYSNEIVTENKPFIVVRLSSSQPLSGTYFFQQIDRISGTRSPLSQLDLSVIEADAPVPCEGKVPRVEMSAEGVLTAESTCDATKYIQILFINVETGAHVINMMVTHEEGGVYQSGSFYPTLLTGVHEVVAYHVEFGQEIKAFEGARLGEILTFQVQLKAPAPASKPVDELIGRIDLPPFFDVEPNTQAAATPDGASDAGTAKVLIAPTTAGVSCSDSCLENVAKQAGITTPEVQTVEASINGGAWVTLTPESTLPLVDVSNKVSIRVTPKDGSKPVVLTNTLYRAAEALSGSDVAEVVALSVGGEQTITAEPVRSGISPAQTILLALAVLILLVLAMLFMRARRKPRS